MRLPARGLALFCALAAAAAPAAAHEDHEAAAAPEAPLFEPPAPGSYELPPIAGVADHRLLDPQGQRVSLLPLAGQVAFVSFVYLSCGEGCPLATATLQRLDHQIAERESLARRVQLVTVSFDPERDTPEAMGRFATAVAPRSPWRFLTAASREEVAAVLADFGQDVVALRGSDGTWKGRLRHVLKVFLVDAEGRIRNVYSTGFLDSRILLNDALTLLGE